MGAAVAGHHLHERRRVAPPVAHLHLFKGGERAGRGGQDQCAPVARMAQAHLAHRLEQFAREQRVQPARHRVQPEHGAASPQFALVNWEKLEVVSGRARALCHTGNGRGLGRVACLASGLDQPFGEHAAALATQGADEQ